MTFWILIILGIIQGLTEFLPISSSGHLVLLYKIFGIENDTILLSIILHIATLLAVIVYYRKDIWSLIRHPLCNTNRKIIVTTLFTCIMALILKPIIDLAFDGSSLSIFFVITGILLWISDWYASKPSKKTLNLSNSISAFDIENLPLTYRQAIVIGISQGVACIPGISRSGTTIATSRILGLNAISAKYSFLISIPIIIASLLLEILSGATLSNISILGLILSFILCFLVGLLCIKIMTKSLQKNTLKYFSIYLFILALFMTINSLFLHWF